VTFFNIHKIDGDVVTIKNINLFGIETIKAKKLNLIGCRCRVSNLWLYDNIEINFKNCQIIGKMHFTSSSDINFNNCEFNDGTLNINKATINFFQCNFINMPIVLTNSDAKCFFNNCSFSEVNGNAIDISNGSFIEIKNSTFTKCTKPALAFYKNSKGIIHSSKIYDLQGTNGIVVRSGSEIEIVQCEFFKIDYPAIFAEDRNTLIKIKDTVIHDILNIGLWVENYASVIIENSNIFKCLNQGIKLSTNLSSTD
jgi:hypothetical protein